MNQPNLTRPAAEARAQKYLTFRCAKEEFAVPVGKVKEIIGMQEITAVPQTPDYVKGVFNLRGRVIPVIDLRLRLGVAAAPYDARTCIIVMEPEDSGSVRHVGVVVDTVSEVLSVSDQHKQAASEFGRGLIQSRYVSGVARVRDGMKLMLDIDLALAGVRMESHVA